MDNNNQRTLVVSNLTYLKSKAKLQDKCYSEVNKISLWKLCKTPTSHLMKWTIIVSWKRADKSFCLPNLDHQNLNRTPTKSHQSLQLSTTSCWRFRDKSGLITIKKIQASIILLTCLKPISLVSSNTQFLTTHLHLSNLIFLKLKRIWSLLKKRPKKW